MKDRKEKIERIDTTNANTTKNDRWRRQQKEKSLPSA